MRHRRISGNWNRKIDELKRFREMRHRSCRNHTASDKVMIGAIENKRGTQTYTCLHIP